jgi:hypothetical protein
MDLWHPAAGDPYPMEKNPNEIPMFARFVERGLAVPTNDFFKGLLRYYGIDYLNLKCTSMKHSWESNPTGSCFGSFSE